MPIGPVPLAKFLPGGILTGPVAWTNDNSASGGIAYELDTLVGPTTGDLTRQTDGLTGFNVMNNAGFGSIKTSAAVPITSTAFSFVIFMDVDAGFPTNFAGIFDLFPGAANRKVFFSDNDNPPTNWTFGSSGAGGDIPYFSGRIVAAGRCDSATDLVDLRMIGPEGSGEIVDFSVTVTANFNFGILFDLTSEARKMVGSIGEFWLWDSKLSNSDYDTVFQDMQDRWLGIPSLINLRPQDVQSDGTWENDGGIGGFQYGLLDKIGTAGNITRVTDTVTGFNMSNAGSGKDGHLETLEGILIQEPWSFVMFIICDFDDLQGADATLMDAKSVGGTARTFVQVITNALSWRLGRQGGPPHTTQNFSGGRLVIAGRLHDTGDLQDFYVSAGVDQRNWVATTPTANSLDWGSLFGQRTDTNRFQGSCGELKLWDRLITKREYTLEIDRLQRKWGASVSNVSGAIF